MKRLNIDILGMSEIIWKDEGDFWSDNYRVTYLGDKNSNTGFGIILTKEWGQRAKIYLLYNDIIMLVKLKTDENDIHAKFRLQRWRSRGSLWTTIRSNGECEKNDNLIILGDWNAVVGEGQEEEAVGKYGLGVRINRGQKLIDFCIEKELTNTIFQQRPRRGYTWVKPSDTARYQIDYIMVKKKHKIYVQQSKMYPWADICSDHNVVFMKYKLQCKKKIYKYTINNSKWAVSKLKEDREIEEHNKRVKQNLNYRDRDNRYNSTMEELKTSNNNSCKRNIREIKVTT